ncbi:hypothetical protein HFD88_004669 [Aspergillus terreus]|nr:hypothetical protein HFD88_004669 [Aspergillus terreus]
MSATLSAFPFLTPAEFDCACRTFLHRILPVDTGRFSFRVLDQATGPILNISQSFDYDDAEALSPQDAPVEICDDDPEALIRTSDSDPSVQVEYQVLLSPTYQVPVLYFTLRQTGHPKPLGIDEVYRYMVPPQYRKELQSVGVMGGISLGYHPHSGAPMFFVHPCNTADAMKQIAGHQRVTPELYLMLWLGLVGNRLGLSLPRELFETGDVQSLDGGEKGPEPGMG